MMKKLIAIFIAVLLMSFCLSFTVSAQGTEFTLSEDLRSLTYNGVTYLRADTSMISLNYCDDLRDEPQLTTQQQELLRDCNFSLDLTNKIIEATFYYRDGATLYCGFVAEDFYREYTDYLTSEETLCHVEFYWDASQHPSAAEADFRGTAVTLDNLTLMKAETFPVYVSTDHVGFSMIKGTLLLVQDTFYYANHQEVNHPFAYTLDLYELESLECYQVTDPELVAALEEALGDYYDLAYGTDNLLEAVSLSFWTFIFAVIPLGIFVPALILFIRGKGYHRYTWGATAIFAILSFIMYFVVVVPILLS